MARKRHFFQKILALLAGAALLAGPLGAAAAEEAPEEAPALAIYTTGGMAGRTWRQDPLTGQTVEQGWQNAAAALAAERAAGTQTLVLDSGDAVGAGPLQDGGAAVAAALRSMGCDALVPGLNEFRLGPEAREDFFAALTGAEGAGTPVRVLSGSYLDADSQEPVEEAFAVFQLELEGAPLRVAVLGLGPLDAADHLPDGWAEGVRFAHGDNEENSPIWEWTHYWQPRVEAEHCDLVVVVYGAGSGAADFAAGTAGIDLVVGGGEARAETLRNAAGESVTLVSGGGAELTRTVITRDGDGGAKVGESTLLSLAGYEPDDSLDRLLAPLREEAAAGAAETVGVLTGDWAGQGDPLCVPTPAVELAAAAMRWAAGAQGALLSPGSLGEEALSGRFPEGSETLELTLADCAALLPGGEPVAAVELTGAQLRAWLDRCAGAYRVEADGSVAGGEDADVLCGLSYSLYLGAPAGERAAELTLDGRPVADGQLLRIAVSVRRLDDPEFPQGRVLWRSDEDARFAARGGAPAALLADYLADQTARLGRVSPRQSGSWAIYTGSPDGPLNRLELVSMLYDLAGRPTPGASAAFIDVGDSPAAVWAAETGVVSGNGQGKFLPTQTVTREQAAVMLYNYARAQGVSAPASGPALDGLADGASVAAWARPAAEFCLRTGALAPDAAGCFRPGGTLTRTEASSALEALAIYLAANQ